MLPLHRVPSSTRMLLSRAGSSAGRRRALPCAGVHVQARLLPIRRDEEDRQTAQPQVRAFHATARTESTGIFITSLGVAGVAYGGKVVFEQIDQWQQRSKAAEEGGEEEGKEKKGSGAGGVFSSFFSTSYYEGGFEDKMTRREAALILGIREGATKEKIKEAHRRVLLLNHPDRGGSTHVASKINEAKEKLLPGAEDD